MEYNVVPITQLEQASWDQVKDGEYVVPVGFPNQTSKESKYIDIWQLQDTINISQIIEQATEHSSGLMSAEDKVKLNNLDPSVSMNDNLINGNAEGSLRTIGSFEEESDYSLGQYAFAEGNTTKASGYASHAEGFGTIASGNVSHAEGYFTQATSDWSHVEGFETLVSGSYAHAEGSNTIASDAGSHAEGTGTRASAEASHAEGSDTIASGIASHAQGSNTIASGDSSHTEGTNVTASGNNSHAQNYGTVANSANQTAIGKYNIADNNNEYAFIIGNGTDDGLRSNAGTLDWQGNLKLAGDIYVNNSNSTDNKLVKYSDVSNIINNSSISTIENKVNKIDIGYSASKNISNTSFLDLIYPVGSIYMSLDPNLSNPNTLFGGEWEKLPEGRMLLNSGTNAGVTYPLGDATKGNKDAIIPTHTHTIAAKNSAGTTTSHNGHHHTAGNATDKNNKNTTASFVQYNYGVVNSGLSEVRVASTSSGSHYVPYCGKSAVDFWGARTGTATAGAHSHTVNLNAQTVPAPANASAVTNANMPPYMVVNMWQRIN